jgi:hypothetical protein
MSLGQVGDSRRQRADEVFYAFGAFTVSWRLSLKERLERHANDVGRPTAQAARCLPEAAAQRSRQTDGDLIVHEWISNPCTAIVVQRTAGWQPRSSTDDAGRVMRSTERIAA